MVAQPVTAARNALSQGARLGIEGINVGIESKVGGASWGQAIDDAVQTWSGALHAFQTPKQASRFAKLMDTHADAFRELRRRSLTSETANPAATATIGARADHALGFLNNLQEKFYQRAAIEGVLRRRLPALGIDVQEALANPTLIPADVAREAAERAGRVTFAEGPQGEPGRWFLKAWKTTRPIATTITPYPRFVMTGARFVFNHNPTGLLRLLGERGFAAQPRVLAEAASGTMLLGSALALRQSSYAGEKWNELRVGDHRVDARLLGPMASYLFLAHVITKAADGQLDDISTKDVTDGLLSMSRAGGTVSVIGDILSGHGAGTRANLERLAGDYLSGFTVPFHALRDAVATVDDTEGERHDLREHPLLGPTVENLPGASRLLPAQYSITRPGPNRAEHPAIKQLVGAQLTEPNSIERELSRLGMSPYDFAPKTGLPDVDRELSKRVGRASPAIARFIDDPRSGYAEKSDAEKQLWLRQAYSSLSDGATKHLMATDPARGRRLWLKRYGALKMQVGNEARAKQGLAPLTTDIR